MAWVNTDKDYNGETLTGGYLYIANGGTVRDMIVGSGGVLEIYTGGMATENQVAKAGRVMISGGTLEKTSVDAGFVYVFSAGAANEITLANGGEMQVGPEGGASGTIVEAKGEMFVSSNGFVKDTDVKGNGIMTIHSGGSAEDITVSAGGALTVSSGATVTDLVLEAGASLGGFYFDEKCTIEKIENGSAAISENIFIINNQMHLTDGGVFEGGTFTKRELHVSEGGFADGTEIGSGGRLLLLDGGRGEDITVSRLGVLTVSSGASVTGVTANGGAQVYLYAGVNAVDVTVSDGALLHLTVAENTTIKGSYNNIAFEIVDGKLESENYLVSAGCELHVDNGGEVSGVWLNGGYMCVSGGLADNTSVNVGYLEVVDDGKITDTMIATGSGSLKVFSGGSAERTTVKAGTLMHVGNGGVAATTELWGDMVISGGGSAAGTTVSGGGLLHVSSGGVATQTNLVGSNVTEYGAVIEIIAGSMVIFEGGSAADTTVSSGGILHISNGGVADNTTVINGGELHVFSGGAANGAILFRDNFFSSFGALHVSMGGVANGVVVSSGGELHVSSGGTAGDTVVSQNGVFYLSNGGVANGTTLSAGQLYVLSGGRAFDTTLDKNNGNSYCLTISSGGTAENTTIENGYVSVGLGAIHRGYLDITGNGRVWGEQGGIVDFTLSGKSADDTTTVEDDRYLINDLSKIWTSATFTITVAQSQGNGTYLLAQNASKLIDKTITISEDNGEKIVDITVNGEVVTHQGVDYHLVCDNDNNLKLEIWDMPEIHYTVEPGSWTTGNVTITVSEANAQTGIWQYKGDDDQWVTINAEEGKFSFVVTDNQTITVQFTNEFDKTVSETIEITQIDRELPGVPQNIEAAVEGNTLRINWDDVSDAESGLKGYVLRYGKAEDLDGCFTADFTDSECTIENLGPGKWYYQVGSVDQAGNVSWSEIESYEIAPVQISWEGNREIQFTAGEKSLTLATEGNQLDIVSLPQGEIRWETGYLTGGGSPQAEILKAAENDVEDLFFACSNSKWEEEYAACHQTTGDMVDLEDKNRFDDVFIGSSDANILLLTDDEDGDAFFVDDVYTALGNQSRFSQIHEIFAGAGDDIIDMTSKRFTFKDETITLHGGNGNDVLWGGAKENILYGDAGFDTLVGAAGNDTFYGGADNDKMSGCGGDDAFYFSGSWGQDIVEQYKRGSVTLYIENYSANNWKAETMTYTYGDNTITVIGCANVKFESWSSTASEHDTIFKSETSGMIA